MKMKKLYRCLLLINMAGAAVPALADTITGAPSTDFTASVFVTSDRTCTLTVSPPTSTTFTANWTGNTASAASTMTVTSPPEPQDIVVRATGSDDCSVNNIKLTAQVNNATLAPNERYAFVTHFSDDGYWRFMPLLGRAQFFTDTAMQVPATGTVTFNGPLWSSTFQNAPQYNAGDKLDDLPDMEGTGMFLTNDYVADGGAILIADGLSSQSSFYFGASAATYKAAKLGIGAMIATDPERANGQRDVSVANNNSRVDMNWVVTISAS